MTRANECSGSWLSLRPLLHVIVSGVVVMAIGLGVPCIAAPVTGGNGIAAGSCSNLIGLASIFNGGVDLTRVGLNTVDHAFRPDVIDFTCKEGKTYESYSVPDQIIGLRPIPSSGCDISVWAAGTYAAATAGIQQDFSTSFLGLMSASEAMELTVGATVENAATVGVASCSVTSFEVFLAPIWELTPGKQLKRVVRHYLARPEVDASDTATQCVAFNETTVDSFNKVIASFGTGLLTNGTVGGVAQLFFGAGSSYSNFMTDDDLSASAKASLFNVVSAAGGASGHLNASAHFNDSLVFGTSKTVGGTGTPFGSSTSWNDWAQTVVQNPALVQMSYSNLSSLVSNWDAGCGRELHKAEQNYYMRAFLSQVLISTLEKMQTFLDPVDKFPHCAFSGGTRPCKLKKLPPLVNKTLVDIRTALKHSPITTKVQTFAFSAAVAALALELPPAPPKLVTHTITGTSWHTIEAQGCFVSDVLSESATIVTQPGTLGTSGGFVTFRVKNQGPSAKPVNVTCFNYPAAAEAPSKHFLGYSTSTGAELGKFWACIPLDNQAAVNLSASGLWTGYQLNDASGGVLCFDKPPANFPHSVSTYTLPSVLSPGLTLNLGRHYFCYFGITWGPFFVLPGGRLRQDASMLWTFVYTGSVTKKIDFQPWLAFCIG